MYFSSGIGIIHINIYNCQEDAKGCDQVIKQIMLLVIWVAESK